MVPLNDSNRNDGSMQRKPFLTGFIMEIFQNSHSEWMHQKESDPLLPGEEEAKAPERDHDTFRGRGL